MNKPANSRWLQLFWLVVFTSFIFSFYLYHSSYLVKKTGNQIAHSLVNQATQQIDHENDRGRDDGDEDRAPPIDKLPAEDGIVEDSVSVTEEVKKPKSDYKTSSNHSAVDQDSGGVTEEAEKPVVEEKKKAIVEDEMRDAEEAIEEGKIEKMPTDEINDSNNNNSVSNGATGNVEEEPIKKLPLEEVQVRKNVEEEKKIDADKLPDGTMNPAIKKGSVQGVGDRGNAREENKIDAGETSAAKLPVGDENKKQSVVQDAGSIRKNGEEVDKIDGTKMVGDKLPVNVKNHKQGFVQGAGNIKVNAQKVGKIDAVKMVADENKKQDYVKDAGNIKGNADKLPVADTVKAARGKQSKEGNNDVPSKVSGNELKTTQQIPKEEGRRRGRNGDQNRVITKQPTMLDNDSCWGRYIYIHELPGRFNEDMIRNCNSLSKWVDMCQYIANFGLGPQLNNSRKEFSHGGWFATNQFSLEVIFHNRMKRYKCLTKDSSKASAIYLPYYAGLDVSRYLWYDKELKDSAAVDVVRWLRDQPEWKRMWGRDHFFVAGRITWDFRREGDNLRNWGNKLMFLPEAKNMTILTIESSPWHSNDFGIPYPTYFHPKSDYEIRQWQRKVRKIRRKYLFCFAGAPRPNLRNSIRGEIISQCQAARGKCRLLECLKENKCYQPVHVMNMFESSIFCLQPAGDSFTRRSTFDSILAGCIPVFFHPASAYVQYIWYFTKDYHKYSVWIPGKDVKEGKVNIEAVLSGIPKEKVVAMREQLIRLIPKITYADPGSQMETTEDAFDIAVNGVLERVEGIRREMKEGKNTSFSFDEEKAWKFYTYGILGEHEWDSLFDRSRSNSLMN